MIIPFVHFVLASASPRRRELLAAAGFSFDVDPVDVDESRRKGERSDDYACRLAHEKAAAGALRHPATPVLGADTIVVVSGEVLGKPADREDAVRMLRRLSGTTHEVVTAVALALGPRVEVASDRTTVWFRRLSEAEIQAYVDSGEPMDKAGAYAIQGFASRFIPRIEGAYTTVVGLPVALVARLLDAAGGAEDAAS